MPKVLAAIIVGFLTAQLGCGTTRWTDTSRTATEQMLISDAVDRAVSQIDFSALAGQQVFLDARFVFGVTDDRYIISTMRQHMLASGCIVKDKLEDADLVVELRTGAVGTNRNDLLFGTPSTQLPTLPGTPGGGTMIPEIALFKRTSQQGVCKLAVFAYDRNSGQPVWQSGNRHVDSRSRDMWVMGAGPFQSGSIHKGTKLSGEKFSVPLQGDKSEAEKSKPTKHAEKKSEDKVWVAEEIRFQTEPNRLASHLQESARPMDAQQASFKQSVTPSLAPAPPAAAPVPSAPQTVPPTPPPVPPAARGSVSTQQGIPNPAAAGIGAINAFDWARSVRGE